VRVGLKDYRTKRVGFMVTFPLFGAEKSGVIGHYVLLEG